MVVLLPLPIHQPSSPALLPDAPTRFALPLPLLAFVFELTTLVARLPAASPVAEFDALPPVPAPEVATPTYVASPPVGVPPAVLPPPAPPPIAKPPVALPPVWLLDPAPPVAPVALWVTVLPPTWALPPVWFALMLPPL